MITHVSLDIRDEELYTNEKKYCCLGCSDHYCSASFMRRKGAQLLVATLELYGTGDAKDGTVTKEACYALRSVTMGDDRRKDFSCKLLVPSLPCCPTGVKVLPCLAT